MTRLAIKERGTLHCKIHPELQASWWYDDTQKTFVRIGTKGRGHWIPVSYQAMDEIIANDWEL